LIILYRLFSMPFAIFNNQYQAKYQPVCRFRTFCKIWPLLIFFTAFLCGCKSRKVTTPTPQMGAETEYWVRVLLLNDVNACTLKTTAAFTVTDTQKQNSQNRTVKVNVPLEVAVSAGEITIGGQPVTSDRVIISPNEPHIFNLNGADYRGSLKLIVNSDANSFDAINHVPLEPYLAGVVGAEMPHYWEPEALKAQAIASRTYCLYIKKRFGQRRNWDVRRTQAHQVYRGINGESVQIWRAVNQTEGRVLTCIQPDGSEDIFPTYYSSTCGGHTENSSNVFGDSFEPLVGVPCSYCRDVARQSCFFWPAVQFDQSNITDKLLQRYPNLKPLGQITNISPAGQSNYGEFTRVTKVKLLGSTGKSDFLKAEDFRLTMDPTGLKLKSTICQIVKEGDKWVFLSGRGYGHGVGMCQCGAEGMARQNKTAEQILAHYYPGSKIVGLYRNE